MRRFRAARTRARWRACRSPSRPMWIRPASPPPTGSSCSATSSRRPTARWSTICCKAGAVIIGRTNYAGVFAIAGSPPICCTASTKNPRDPALTPGGSSGGAAAARRRRHRPYRPRHRYRRLDPLSGLCLRRARAAADASAASRLQRLLPERAIGGADHGGVGSAGAHHRRSQARARGDVGARRRAIPGGCRRRWRGRRCRSAPALCLRPDGLAIVAEVKAAVADAAGGWSAPAGGREDRARRRCARPRTCRPALARRRL